MIQKKDSKILLNFFQILFMAANSNAILNFKEFNYSLVRSGGICIFGTTNHLKIKNVIEFLEKCYR